MKTIKPTSCFFFFLSFFIVHNASAQQRVEDDEVLGVIFSQKYKELEDEFVTYREKANALRNKIDELKKDTLNPNQEQLEALKQELAIQEEKRSESYTQRRNLVFAPERTQKVFQESLVRIMEGDNPPYLAYIDELMKEIEQKYTGDEYLKAKHAVITLKIYFGYYPFMVKRYDGRGKRIHYPQDTTQYVRGREVSTDYNSAETK